MPAPAPRILIVDDEAPLMTALCNTLEQQGYTTAGFSSGRRALDELARTRFDLVLTDLMMPEMDGISLVRSALGIDSTLACIMITGEGTISTAVEAMQAGAFDYILKPFKLSVILPVLSRALAVRQLRAENQALERRVLERTAELEAANRELEAFSYSVSHDLRAPLRQTNAYIEMVLGRHSDSLPPKALQFLNGALSSTLHMDRLIGDLLRFSRLGRAPLAKQTIDVSALVSKLVEGLRHEHAGRVIEVVLGVLPDCIGDAALLEQVFVNLLSNAFKFTRQKAPAIIEVGCLVRDGNNVYFVRDNGTGFDMRHAGKLFGVFQRLHSADEFEGTGVGLSLVQRIVQRHGGKIWAEAEMGKGAAFYFTLGAPERL